MTSKKQNATAMIHERYNRLAALYDFMEWPLEKMRFDGWRKRLGSRISGSRALEVGVGTGKNMPYYPSNVSITAIDFSGRMVARARRNAIKLNLSVDLLQMDVQRLVFPDNFFDTVFATFVFFGAGSAAGVGRAAPGVQTRRQAPAPRAHAAG